MTGSKSTKRFIGHAIGLLLMTTQALAQDHWVYVANESDDTVSLLRFDGAEAAVAKTIPVGRIPTEIEGPHGLALSPDGAHWYVSLAHGQPYGSVTKYRTGTDERLGSVTLGYFPATMVQSHVTGLLYVANFDLHGSMNPSTVSVVDPVSMREVGRVTTGTMPHGSRLSPAGTEHYSVSMMGGVLFEDQRAKPQSHPYPARCDQAYLGGASPPLAPRPVVADSGGNVIVDVDLESWSVARRLEAQGAPYNVAVTPDGSRVVATLKSAASIGVYDFTSGAELARIESARAFPHGVVLSPDGRYAFVSVEGVGSEPGAVDIIDLDALQRVATVNVGMQAGGIAYWNRVDSAR